MSKHVEKFVQYGRMLFANVHKLALAIFILCLCACAMMVTAKFTGASIHTPWFDINAKTK